MPVTEVDPAELHDRNALWILLLAAMLLEFLLQFHHDKGEVVADEVGAADDEIAPDQRRRDDDDEHRGAQPDEAVQQGRQHRPARSADEEDVNASHRADHAAEAVGGYRGEHGAHHGEGRQQEHGNRDAEHGPQDGVGHEVLNRRENGDGKDDDADQGQRPCRVLAVEPVVVAPDERQCHQNADAPDGADQPALECVETELLLEVEVAENGHGEQTESDRRKCDETRLDRADAQDPLERRLQGRRRRSGIADDLSQDVLLLELARVAVRGGGRPGTPPRGSGWPRCRRPTANRSVPRPRWRSARPEGG